MSAACPQFVECALFVTVTHAYDVGDYIAVAPAMDPVGQPHTQSLLRLMQVSAISVYHTTLVTAWGETVIMPNCSLAVARINNVSRSQHSAVVTITAELRPDVTALQLLALKRAAQAHVRPTEWQNDVRLTHGVEHRNAGGGVADALHVYITLVHRRPWSTGARKITAARSDFIVWLTAALRSLDIHYTPGRHAQRMNVQLQHVKEE